MHFIPDLIPTRVSLHCKGVPGSQMVIICRPVVLPVPRLSRPHTNYADSNKGHAEKRDDDEANNDNDDAGVTGPIGLGG